MAGRAVEFDRELRRRIDATFQANPHVPDHRAEHPWLTGYLGDPFAPVWFIAENPSLGQVERVKATSPEVQWAVSRGDLLFREMLSRHGFKDEPRMGPGGWRCYLTDVIKSAHRAEEWNRQPAAYRATITAAWSPVLAWELDQARPRLLVSVGKKADKLLDRLLASGLIRCDAARMLIHHYSYIALRADARRRLGPMHPTRLAEYDAQFAAVARTASGLGSR